MYPGLQNLYLPTFLPEDWARKKESSRMERNNVRDGRTQVRPYLI